MDLSEFLTFDLASPSGVEAAYAQGVEVHGLGSGNVLHLHKRARIQRARLALHGSDNRIILGEASAFNGDIVVTGSGSQATVHGDTGAMNLQIHLYSASEFVIGPRSVVYGMRTWVSDGTSLIIGADCQVSDGVNIRTTDHHTIFALDTLEVLNTPESVEIGPCVWLGQDVTVLKGVRIGLGSIVGAKSLVSGSIPAMELWAGSPARASSEPADSVRDSQAAASQIQGVRW